MEFTRGALLFTGFSIREASTLQKIRDGRIEEVRNREVEDGRGALCDLVGRELVGEARERVFKSLLRVRHEDIHRGLGAALQNDAGENRLSVFFPPDGSLPAGFQSPLWRHRPCRW